MKIYLDIDETILNNNLENGILSHKPALYLKPFLQNILEKHQVYWLTTHCNGDATTPVSYLARYFEEDLIPLIMRVKPTKWKERKIEAIILQEDFLWFDDTITDSEKELLRDSAKEDSFIKVDLDKNPNFFKDYRQI